MTSANGGNYTGQYRCDGWVDNLKLTLLTTLVCFLFTVWRKTLIAIVMYKTRSSLFGTETRLNYLFSELIFT